LVVAASVGAAALATAVSTLVVSHQPVNAGPASSIVRGGGALLEFPQDTASDVVSYADQVSLVTAISETRVPDVPAEGDGRLDTRNVTFRIERTLWHREGAPSLEGTFVSSHGGWVFTSVNDGPKVEGKFLPELGVLWVEVGSKYFMPIAFNHDEWGATMPLAEFPFDSDLGVSPEKTQTTPLAIELSGATLDEAAAVFAGAAPDPLAAQHFDLQPSARVRAWMRITAERKRLASRSSEEAALPGFPTSAETGVTEARRRPPSR
jgi:hypothetical protein